jgi:hypothetical protein
MTEKIIAFVAFMTLFLSIITKVIGFPSQARLIHKTKKVDNISLPLYAITFLSYCFWTLHGYFKHDNTIVIGQGLGIVTTGFILGQLIYYRRKGD